MLKWSLIGLGAVALLLLALLLALPLLLDTPALQAYVAQAASQAVGRPVKFASLSVSGFPLPTVRLKDLQVAEDPAWGPGPLLAVREGRLGIRLLPLLSGRVELADVTLEQPRLALVEDPAGRWNLAALAAPAAGAPGAPRGGPPRAPGAAPAVLLARVRVVDGTLLYRKGAAGAPEWRLEKIDATLTQAGPGGALQVRGEARGEPGGLRLRIGEGALTPAGGRALADGVLKATVEVEARDVGPLARLLVGSPALAGPLAGRLSLGGSLAQPSATGSLRLDRLAVSEERAQCAEPRRRELVLSEVRAPLEWGPRRLESAPLEARVARGEVAFRLGVVLGARPVATLKDIRVRGVELAPVLVDYLCQAYAVTGPLDLTGEATLSPGDPLRSLDGAGRLRVGPGRVVGQQALTLVDQVAAMAQAVSSTLGGALPGRGRRSALDFDAITATYAVRDGVLRTDDLTYEAGDVRITGAGTYGLPDGRVNMDVTFTQGANRIRGKVTGTAGSVRVVPTGVTVPQPRDLRRFLERLLR